MASSDLAGLVGLIEEGKAVQATQEVGRCLEDQSSAAELVRFGARVREMAETEAGQRESLMEVIQGYLDLKEGREASLSEKLSQEVLMPELEQAQNDKTESRQKLTEFRQELQAVQRELDHLADLQVRLESHRGTVKEQTTEVLPKTRYIVSLYQAATKLSWDFTSPPEEVKGYISTSKDVRPFALDSRQNSKFFITNYLWDLIESATG